MKPKTIVDLTAAGQLVGVRTRLLQIDGEARQIADGQSHDFTYEGQDSAGRAALYCRMSAYFGLQIATLTARRRAENMCYIDLHARGDSAAANAYQLCAPKMMARAAMRTPDPLGDQEYTLELDLFPDPKAKKIAYSSPTRLLARVLTEIARRTNACTIESHVLSDHPASPVEVAVRYKSAPLADEIFRAELRLALCPDRVLFELQQPSESVVTAMRELLARPRTPAPPFPSHNADGVPYATPDLV